MNSLFWRKKRYKMLVCVVKCTSLHPINVVKTPPADVKPIRAFENKPELKLNEIAWIYKKKRADVMQGPGV